MVKDIAASVHRRLLNKARAQDQPFNELLQYFVIERFLYRLSKSPHADQFVLKGALLFRVWMAQDSRATRDIDFLAFGDNTVESLVNLVTDVVSRDATDGLVFDTASVEGLTIKEDADYEGVRIMCDAFPGKAKSRLQLDIAFGDTVHPVAVKHRHPTLLDHAAPELYLYPVETVFAEKLEAMIQLGELNSRMKDFYDVWQLMKSSFEGRILLEAVNRTLANRGTQAVQFDVLVNELNQRRKNKRSGQLSW